MLHTIYDKAKHPSQTIIGNDVSVGHNATIHGAIIEDNCLIGMGSTILDNAHVPSGCIIAANALVLSNAQLEPNSVYAGVPARKVKEVTPEQRDEIIRRTAHATCSMRRGTRRRSNPADGTTWGSIRNIRP